MLDVIRLSLKLGVIAGVITLCSCGGNYSETIEVVRVPGYQQSHGPFDSKGNYVEKWADKPPRRIFVDKISEKKKTKESTLPKKKAPSPAPVNIPPTPVAPRIYTPPVQALPTSPPRITQPTTPAPVSRPQAQVIKPRTLAPIQHRVSSTDTLYGLSRRYGVSISSIQRANGLRGTTIITGSTILIPR